MDQLQSGQKYGEAVQIFERGLAMAENLPFQRDLRNRLRDQCTGAKRLHVAQQVHELADDIRVLYGADFIPPARLQALASYCRAFWAKRGLIADASLGRWLAEHAGSAELSASDTALDLLDIAIFAADLESKLRAGSNSQQARREALQILDEAEAMFGTSAVLEYERQVHRRALGLAETAVLSLPDRRARASLRDLGLPAMSPTREAEELNEPVRATRPVPPTPRTAWEHYALGRAFLACDDFPRAAEELTAALEQDPAGCWPNFYYGLCAYRVHRYDDAVAAFGVCIGAAPNVAGCYYNRALALAALGRIDQATIHYDRALAIDPAHAPAALNRAMLHYEQRQLDQAIADLRLALDNGADPATVHYNLALVHWAAQDPAALDDVRHALQLNPAHQSARQLHETLQNGLRKRNATP
jgi:tetratricopeptide (TPR) repeat protein